MIWVARIGLGLALLGGAALAVIGTLFGVLLAGFGEGSQTGSDWIVLVGIPTLAGVTPFLVALWLGWRWIKGVPPGIALFVVIAALVALLLLVVVRTGLGSLFDDSPGGLVVLGALLSLIGFGAHILASRAVLS